MQIGKKVSILGMGVILLSACTPMKSEDFTSVYNGHVDRVYDVVSDWKKAFLFEGTQKDAVRFTADIPGIMNGVLNVVSDGKVKWSDVDVAISATGAANVDKETIALEEFKGAMTIAKSIIYGRVDAFALTGSMVDEAFVKMLPEIKAKALGKWFSLDQMELDKLAGNGQPVDAMVEQISRNIQTLTLEEIRDLLKKNPFFKVLEDQGVVNGKYTYKVALSKEWVRDFGKSLAERITGTGVDAAAMNEFSTALWAINLEWTLSVDAEDKLYFEFHGVGKESATGSGASVNFDIALSRTGLTLAVGDAMNKLSIATQKLEGGKYSMTLWMLAEGLDIVKITNEWTIVNGALTALTSKAEGTIQWNLVYSYVAGIFKGDLTAGILGQNAKIQFGGKYIEKLLSEFSLEASLPSDMGARIAMKPTKENWIAGDLALKFAGQEVTAATLALRVMKNIFDIRVEVKPEIAGQPMNFELNTKTEQAPGKVDIIVPTGAVPFSQFIESIGMMTAPTMDTTNTPMTLEELSGALDKATLDALSGVVAQ